MSVQNYLEDPVDGYVSSINRSLFPLQAPSIPPPMTNYNSSAPTTPAKAHSTQFYLVSTSNFLCMWIVALADKAVSHLSAFSRSKGRFFGVLLKGTLLLCEGDSNRFAVIF
jgi:hypothetical protein